jgi:hypothetical protein
MLLYESNTESISVTYIMSLLVPTHVLLWAGRANAI